MPSRLQKVLDRLKSEGVAAEAIETTNVSVYPIRTYNPETGQETLTGYRAQNSVTVTLADAGQVGKVLSAAVEAGANIVSGPVWKLSDDTAAVAAALKKAVANARTKAEALAEAQGVKVGDVVMMNESSVDVPVYPVYYATDSAKAGGVMEHSHQRRESGRDRDGDHHVRFGPVDTQAGFPRPAAVPRRPRALRAAAGSIDQEPLAI